MARSILDRTGGVKWCSYKSLTIFICLVNLVVVLYLLCSIRVFSSQSSGQYLFPVKVGQETVYHVFFFWHLAEELLFFPRRFLRRKEHVRRTEESARIRRTLEPVELVRLVKQLSKRFDGERLGWDSDQSVKQKLAGEILQRLSELGPGTNATEQRGFPVLQCLSFLSSVIYVDIILMLMLVKETVGLWLAEKLKSLKLILLNSTTESSMLAKDANILARALESDRKKFLEDIGLWIPSETNNYEINDNPENATEFEEDLIPGQLLPPECHADPHTDYDGLAVRWGPTHHKATLLIVVRHAVEPRLNFKDKYPETYRDSHPKAPVNVPWISGVLI
ncbi:hypothetical protein AXF42_Ash010829 [Apostasia shenzhenica]|uniref:Uncharacterized protein n=1 Tax=Apostasia shenzhenica TaxID=1088818 RepID=A0A2I0A0T6_9ASPA|nr:hypothetical protein AXF42_Ash010829 [Apostasia shenzhenica]